MSKGYQTEAMRQAEANKPKAQIKIIEARGIKAADFGGTSDPFVEIRVDNQVQSQKTKVIKKTLNPFWNEEFTVTLDDMEKGVIHIKLYDYDSASSNDLLGIVDLLIPSVQVKQKPDGSGTGEVWYQLQKKKGASTYKPAKGEIKMAITINDPSKKPAAAAAAPAAAAPAPAQPQVVYVQQAAAPQYPQQYPAAAPQYPPQQYPPQAAYPAQPQYPPQAAYPPQPQYPAQPQYPPQAYGAPPAGYPQYPPQGAPQYPPPGY